MHAHQPNGKSRKVFATHLDRNLSEKKVHLHSILCSYGFIFRPFSGPHHRNASYLYIIHASLFLFVLMQKSGRMWVCARRLVIVHQIFIQSTMKSKQKSFRFSTHIWKYLPNKRWFSSWMLHWDTFWMSFIGCFDHQFNFSVFATK